MTKSEAIEMAKFQSMDGCVQHVDYQTRCDNYIVTDWYDSSSTIASFVYGKLKE